MYSSEQDLLRRIKDDKIQLLFDGTWPSVIATAVVGAIFASIHFSLTTWQNLVYWYASLLVVLLLRGLLERRYRAAKTQAGDLQPWVWRYRLGVISSGMIFGSAGLLFYPPDSVAHQAVTVVLLAGMSAGALTVLVSDLISFAVYISFLLLPCAAISLSYSDRLHVGIGLLLIAFYGLLLRSSYRIHDLVDSSLRLRYINLSLVDNLEREKHRLDNRLGRILNDSSNEIYVMDAQTLKCLQVNLGATQNLGYNQEEITGLGMLDILVNLEQAHFAQLIQPLLQGGRDSVPYQGKHRRKDGSLYDVEGRLQLSTEEEPPVYVATVLDVTARKESESKLIQQANFDQLTSLPNRYYMMTRIDDAFARARREHTKVALLFMDLDNFKNINDTLGHNIGDLLLQQAAVRIRSVLRGSDTPARLGGDEFLVMLEGLQHGEQAEVVSRKLVESFERAFTVEGREIYTTTSIGISVFPDDGESVDLLMQHADTAMYQAKVNGRDHYQYFSQNMRAATEEHVIIETHLRRALINRELHLVYQPKIDISCGEIIGAEALLRWSSPELGTVSPDKFIRVAENIGLIETIGNWVLASACEEARKWQDITKAPIHVAVNVSSHQFRTGKLLREVEQVLATTGLSPDALELEITESLLVQDTKEPQEILQALFERGIKLALDDFGTGYSSLSYLKRFPLQVLKIDRSFVRDLSVDQNDEVLVEAIVAMAHSLNLEVVAEGVENQLQLDFLRQRGVRFVQGYFYSPPVLPARFRAMLMEQSDGRRDWQLQAG